jgi:FKBP-type peptidyl-prolyl cis-trans isomerase FklB
MKAVGVITALFLMMSSITIAQTLSTKLDSLSYGVGVIVGQNFKKEGLKNIDAKLVAAAIEAAISGQETLIDKKTSSQLYRDAKKEAKEMASQDVILQGQAYLAENGAKPGVTTTATGLQYEVLMSGNGPSPGPSDKVTTHYHGMLIDGTVFDSSVDRGEPISFPVGGVIKGWQEALQLMSVGDKWRVSLPYDLAYGERGAGASIPPYATLIFEVELLGIN